MSKILIITITVFLLINLYNGCPYGYYKCSDETCQEVGHSCKKEIEKENIQLSGGYPFCPDNMENCYGDCLPQGSSCLNKYANNTSQCPEGTTLCNDMCGGTCNNDLTTDSIYFIKCPSYIPEYCNNSCVPFGTPCNSNLSSHQQQQTSSGTDSNLCPHGGVYCDGGCYPSGSWCSLLKQKIQLIRDTQRKQDFPAF